MPYWSLASYIKEYLSQARNTIICYEETAAASARALGFDGVVCGHIHKAEKRFINGILYCNDGDWTESCSALTEATDGKLELVYWTEMQEEMYRKNLSVKVA